MSKISQVKDELAQLVDNIENTVDELNKLNDWGEDAIELTTELLYSIKGFKDSLTKIINHGR